MAARQRPDRKARLAGARERRAADEVDPPGGASSGQQAPSRKGHASTGGMSQAEHNHIIGEFNRRKQHEIDVAVMLATADVHAMYTQQSIQDEQCAASKFADALTDNMSVHNLFSEHGCCMDLLLGMTTEGCDEPKSKVGADKLKAELKEAEQSQSARYQEMITDRDAFIARMQTDTSEDQAVCAKQTKRNAKAATKAAAEATQDTPSTRMLLAELNQNLEFIMIAGMEEELAAQEEAEKSSTKTMEQEEVFNRLEVEMAELRTEHEEERVEMNTRETEEANKFYAELAVKDDLIATKLTEADDAKEEALRRLEAEHLVIINLLKEEDADETQYQLELAEDAAEQHLLDEEDMLRQQYEEEREIANQEYNELVAEFREAATEVVNARQERDNVWIELEELQTLRKVEDENLGKDAFTNHRAGADAAAGHGGGFGDHMRQAEDHKRCNSRNRKPLHGQSKKSAAPWKC